MTATGLDHASLLVSDVERARRFFTGAIGLEELPRPANIHFPGAWLRVGAQQLHLIGEAEPGRANRMSPRYEPDEVNIGYANHIALIVADLETTLARVREHGIEPSPVDQRGDGVTRSFVTDPDGHVVELMQVSH
jgi:catechol 2,3-dioxygenase-like lactoylglutathione lyase family enzyme